MLSKPDEIKLIEKAKSGNRKARNALVEHNLKLVMSQANKIYYGRGLSYKSAKFDLIDLIAEGNLGLFAAIDTYDAGYGSAFSTHAIPWIQQKIKRFVMYNKACVWVPLYLQEFIGKYKRLEKEFIEEIGRPPTPEEVSMSLQAPMSMLKLAEQADFGETSMNRPITEDGRELQDILACADQDLKFSENKLDMVIDLLEGRERDIIKRRVRGETLEQIGKVHNRTRERIRQIEKKAIRHIKKRAIQVKRGFVTIGSEEERLNEFKDLLRESWIPVR